MLNIGYLVLIAGTFWISGIYFEYLFLTLKKMFIFQN